MLQRSGTVKSRLFISFNIIIAGVSLSGKNVTVLGRSDIVVCITCYKLSILGKPNDPAVDSTRCYCYSLS